MSQSVIAIGKRGGKIIGYKAESQSTSKRKSSQNRSTPTSRRQSTPRRRQSLAVKALAQWASSLKTSGKQRLTPQR